MTDKNTPKEQIAKIVSNAAEKAKEYGHDVLSLEHLLLAMLKEKDIIKFFKAGNINTAGLEFELNNFLTSNYPAAKGAILNLRQGTESKSVIERAIAQVNHNNGELTGSMAMLLKMVEMINSRSAAVQFLLQSGINSNSVRQYLATSTAAVGGGPNVRDSISDVKEAEEYIRTYCVNLNELAQNSKIDPLIGRHDEIVSLTHILSRRTKNNPILIGPPGVGKTAIAEGVALLITRGLVPETIKNSTVWSLDLGSLIAGTKYRGEFEDRMKNILKSIQFIRAENEKNALTGADPILFIDEIHMMIGAGAAGAEAMDVSNLIKPALAKGELRMIGATTEEEFRKHIEKDRALLRRLKKIQVEEPSIADSKLILRGLRPVYEKFHGVIILDDALDAAVDLSSRYISTGCLPDKAIDIIDNAGARQAISDDKRHEITVSDIEFEVAKITKIPATEIKDEESDKLARLTDDLRMNVFGQDRAIDALTDAVFIARAGLREENKPSGSYLFTGPTGVGKTEIAKTLANTLGLHLIRYDMSEYMEKHSVSKLIGAPPGYVGYGEGDSGSGKLVNDIDSHPHCVLLLDEIEKAHPDIFNVLLQVMDAGKLTSSSGKTVSFRNVILIMTTNAGAKELTKNAIGFGNSLREGADTEVLNDTFSPEFRNRIDAIVKFDRLGKDVILRVVEKFIDALRIRAMLRNVSITVEKPAMEYLANKGYDPHMGARPMARIIADKISKPLSKMMLIGKLVNGGKANVSLVADDIVVSVVEENETEQV